MLHRAFCWIITKRPVRLRLILTVQLFILVGIVALFYWVNNTEHPDNTAVFETFLSLRPTQEWESYWGLTLLQESSERTANGVYVHQDHGYRYTTEVAKPQIYMFGNSALWGVYVPDEDTVPSRLQALVGDAYRVNNRARIGSNIAGELLDLENTSLTRNDIVVFYDGWADAVNPGLCANSSSVSSVVQPFSHFAILAQDYTKKARATFFHFLQPNFHSLPPQNEVERYFARQLTKVNCKPYSELGALYWPAMERLPLIDLMHSLDEIRKEGVLPYYDDVHTTAAGNRAVAQAIYRAIFSSSVF